MILYVIRHAEAVDRGAGIPEGNRYLTPKGRVQFRRTARSMIRSGALPDVILTSPLVRSVQTAEILADRMKFRGEVRVSADLSPGFSLSGLRRILADLPPVQELAVVGHDPDLSDLLAALLSLSAEFRLKKGAAVALRIDPARLKTSAEFLWWVLGKRRIDSRDDLSG